VKLRGALAFDQEQKGYQEAAERLRQLKNPVREKGLPIKPKQSRVKTISGADEEKLLEALGRVDDAPVVAALCIAKFTGVRPAEMWSLRIRDGRLVVTGAKKSHGGQRGADREILIAPGLMEMMPAYLDALREKGDEDVTSIQHRLRYACQRLWPRRKAWPSLYTWRHQMGSNLRAAGRDRAEVAYIMGHQSTKSVDQYGDKRTAKAGTALPRVPEGTDLGRIRVKHRGAQPPPAPTAPVYDFGL
jgi:integrase